MGQVLVMLNRNIKHGEDMKTYTVYRVEYPTNKTERIGTVVDRRRGERNNNAADMLRLAQKLYAKSSIDIHVFYPQGEFPPKSLNGVRIGYP